MNLFLREMLRRAAARLETYLRTPLLLLPHLVFTVKTLISEGTYTNISFIGNLVIKMFGVQIRL